jgi:2-polyprenyl-3-methyl-5-hydroxy-6-metoxy-1,4-benzoquinol methylase
MAYEYTFVPGPLAPAELVEELAALYSNHYGVWSASGADAPRRRVRLSPARLRDWLTPDSKIALAKYDGVVIGYAIVVQVRVKDYGVISWVTQLVIHEAHRHLDVGKTLLFSIWGFSDHFAWGLITANPYAVRALEKATRRRCAPDRIAKNKRKLKTIGIEQTTYVKEETVLEVTSEISRIDTEFFLDHSELPMMLKAAQASVPWVLGDIPEGWEWFAFTFQDQQPIELTPAEIDKMIKASDQVTKQAYSRMTLGTAHRWARHAPDEASFVREWCGLNAGHRVLDLGCGNGRHVLELARMGLNLTGVDYLASSFQRARKIVEHDRLADVQFIEADARTIDLHQQFDAVICLYDVIGSYAEEADNMRILQACAHHLRSGGTLLLSVMNLELTEHQAKHFFSLDEEPNRLADLKPSQTMEKTGNIFNPDFDMIDRKSEIVYRKEQFAEGGQLPVELLVRDRRYRRADIEERCRQLGLEVVWSRFVQTGHWEKALDSRDPHAKEILVLCRKPEDAAEESRS